MLAMWGKIISLLQFMNNCLKDCGSDLPQRRFSMHSNFRIFNIILQNSNKFKYKHVQIHKTQAVLNSPSFFFSNIFIEV